MKPFPLRWRIIGALLGLSLGTTLALVFMARYFLDLSLQTSVNHEMGRALTGALTLAKENYDTRKRALTRVGETIFDSPILSDAYMANQPDLLRNFFVQQSLKQVVLKFSTHAQADASITEPTVSKVSEHTLRLVVPIRSDNNVNVFLVAEQSLDALLDIEDAVHTYNHIEMEESELYQAFILAFLVATASVILLASLVGIRIGFGVTKPLYALIKGTREMARDNLEYRIPKGREDEIGLLIESFNKMAEDLKENRRKRLEAEQIAAWREIARRLAHEIKNPLTPIQLTVQQLGSKYSGDDPSYQKLVTDCTEIVTEEVENLRALVQEFADFARMPALLLAAQDLNKIVKGVVRLYPDARIHNNLSPNLPILELDIEQIRRVLINLIENGIDAAGDRAEITIQTHMENGEICLCVCDNGPGVLAEDRQRIFQPYISSKDSGMGLGLAVVRGIIEDHHGHISVTDAPN
ncbi:MAG: HAMP domain-containing protein, partial [Candidatus Latescibacteria bacterium]|nr:HAMP domain-containing protein [Candidatus Latescibacterota bacterium]